MRPVRVAALALSSTVAAALVIAALLPSSYRVSRSAVIRADAASLSARLADLSTREQWVPWKQTEPTAQFRTTGRPGQPGSTFSWEGQTIGAGTVTLVGVRPAHEVSTRLEFRKPMAMVATDRFTLTAGRDGTTTVTWTAEGSLPWPAGRLFGLVIDRVVGTDYERGLENLRRFAEAPRVAVH